MSYRQINLKTMRKIILIVSVVAIASTNMFGQRQKSPCKTPEQRTEKILDRMKEKLLLSNEQQAKIQPIILKREQQRDEFLSKSEALKDANRKTMKAAEAELKTVLTPAQSEKMKQEREKNKQKRLNKRRPPQKADGNNPPPPAPEQK
jgi:hypothetical protein